MLRYSLADDLDQESVRLLITAADGSQVRELEGPTEAGFHTVYWDFNMDRPYEPSGPGGGFGGGPVGPQVLPGMYTVTLEAAGFTASRDFEVRLDPRIDASRGDLMARFDFMMEAHRLAAPAYEAGRALERMEDQLDAVEAHLDGLESAPENATTALAELRERMEELDELMDQVEDGPGAGFGVRGEFGPPTADQRWALDRGWEALPELIRGINGVIGNELPALFGMVYVEGARPDAGEPLTMPAGRE